SWWITPRSTIGWEALLRYDHLEPNTAQPGTRHRWIGGGAYWVPHHANVSASLMLDVDTQSFDDFATAQRTVTRYAVHAVVNFQNAQLGLNGSRTTDPDANTDERHTPMNRARTYVTIALVVGALGAALS